MKIELVLGNREAYKIIAKKLSVRKLGIRQEIEFVSRNPACKGIVRVSTDRMYVRNLRIRLCPLNVTKLFLRELGRNLYC